MRLVMLAAGLLFSAAPAAAAVVNVVVPNSLENTRGTGGNASPFGCTDPTFRYQQVYAGSEVGSGKITQIAFRPRGGAATAYAIPGVTIRLSSTTHGPDALSTMFSSNVGADATEVFSGSLLISTAGNVAGPAPPPFDMLIPLQHSFTFDASTGKHLLLDVSLSVCPNVPSISAFNADANSVPGDGVSRVFSLAAGGATADTLGLITRFTMDVAGPPPPPTTLVAAVLPYSRSVQVNTPATAFVTILNSGANPAIAVGISLASVISANFTFNQTNCATNAVIGGNNVAVDIPVGGQACYVITVTPTLPLDPIDVTFTFKGTNTPAVTSLVGINTFLLSGNVGPTPDIVAVAGTLPPDPGIVNVPLGGASVFAVAVSNVGLGGTVTAALDTAGAMLGLSLAICETDVAGNCKAPPAISVASSIAGQLDNPPVSPAGTATYGIFITSIGGPVFFDPAVNRIFVRFQDLGGVTRGATSVAVRTQ